MFNLMSNFSGSHHNRHTLLIFCNYHEPGKWGRWPDKRLTHAIFYIRLYILWSGLRRSMIREV